MLNPGDTIERYEVVRTVGIGGHATVYLLKHLTLGSEHALKVVNLHRPDIRARLLQEGRIQATLQHPNIVPVTDVLEVGGLQALLMPFVDGPDLGQWLERHHPVSTDAIAYLFHEIVEAVGFAHRQGLVHRDLKPANILMDRQGDRWRPRITDFGIAKITGGQGAGIGTRSGIGMGTPAYMAPEQVQSAAHVDHRADIFALGCILYEFITGARLYPSANPLLIAAEISSPTPVDLSAIGQPLPPSLRTILKGCLEKNRSRRFPDCDIILHTLQAHHPSAIRTPGPQPLQPRQDGSTGTQTPEVPLFPLRALDTPLFRAVPAAPPNSETAPDPESPILAGSDAPSPLVPATAGSAPRSSTPPRRMAMAVWMVGLTAAALALGGVWLTGRGGPSTRSNVPSARNTPTAAPVPSSDAGTLPPAGSQSAPVSMEADGTDLEAAVPTAPVADPPEITPPTAKPAQPVDPAPAPATPAPSMHNAIGTLSLDSKPYSDIWLDGTARGETWQELRVSSGTHEVRMQDAEGRQHTVALKIGVGETVNYCWDFDVSAPCSL